MTDAPASPCTQTRLTRKLFLLTVVTGIVAQVLISDRLVVPGSASTTASNIVAQAGLFRLGFTIYPVEMAAQIAMPVLFYNLLKPVSRPCRSSFSRSTTTPRQWRPRSPGMRPSVSGA